jgi:hypothetical protein
LTRQPIKQNKGVATRPMNTIIQQLRRAALLQEKVGSTDGQLLESFIARRDEAALAALVYRHGSMALGVCCRILRNHHDAEDAMQATFLVLACKASCVRPRESPVTGAHMKNTERSYQIYAALCPGQKGRPHDFVPVTFFGSVQNRRKSLLEQLMGRKNRDAKKGAPIDVPMSR